MPFTSVCLKRYSGQTKRQQASDMVSWPILVLCGTLMQCQGMNLSMRVMLP